MQKKIQSARGRYVQVAHIRHQFRLTAQELRQIRNGRRIRFFENDCKQWWRDGRMPRRDGQRAKVYRAEREASKHIKQRRFYDVAEVARYVRSLMETKWFQRRFPAFVECRVEYLPGSVVCYGGPRGTDGGEVVRGHIRLSTWGMGKRTTRDSDCPLGGELVVLHELAHAVLPSGHGHDRRWARTYLEFVGFKLGCEAKKELQKQYRTHGVKCSPFRKVRVTEEH